MKQPSSETFLAAELAACGVAPSQAAFFAQDLCRWGRSYFRLGELLCGGEDVWGPQPGAQVRIEKAERRRTVLHKRIEARLFDAGAQFELDSDGGGLGLLVKSRAGITALR